MLDGIRAGCVPALRRRSRPGEAGRRSRRWPLVLLLAACGCGQASERPPEAKGREIAAGAGTQGGSEPRTLVYECPEGPRLVVRIEGEQAVVFAPGETLSLPRTESASGVRYSDGQATFWSKGEAEAMFELSGGSWTGCRSDPAEAVWEHAKLNGADFRAIGNEPGWVLVMYPDRWILETDYGETRVEVPASPPTGDPEAYRTVWVSEAAGHSLRIVVQAGPCQDTMADETYGTRVTVELDGVSYQGCGRALH